MRTRPRPAVQRNDMPDDVQARPPGRRISRRGFLGGVGLAGILALLFHNSIGRLLRPAASLGDSAPPPAALGDHELQTLAAFGRVLIPSAFISARADAVIRTTLDEHATDGAFAAAVALLDAQSAAHYQARFVELDGERQRAVVHRLLDSYTDRTPLSTAYYYLTEDGRRIRHLWSAVAQPIVVGFYTSSLGWQVVGYPLRPGECSNLVDYQYPIG